MRAIVIETSSLHLGYLGCYGNDWVATPALDRLAAQAVVFDQHYADAPGATVPTSWTGRHQFAPPKAPCAAADTPGLLDRLLQAQGSSVTRLGDWTRFGTAAPTTLEQLQATLEAALAHLKKLAKKDGWLLWLNLPGLAPPWQLTEEFLELYFPPGHPEEGEEPLEPWLDPPWGPVDTDSDATVRRLQNTYAAAVTCFDAHLGEFIDTIEKRGVLESSWLVVTADRGMALGEHGVLGDCRPWLHAELIHLPLIVRLPSGAEAGRRVLALTQPVDLAATLLAAFGAAGAEHCDGKDLGPLLTGQADSVRTHACSVLLQGERSDWALRTGDWAYIVPVSQAVDDVPRPPQLYVKPDDRWEVNNLLQHHLELVDQLKQTLCDHVTRVST